MARALGYGTDFVDVLYRIYLNHNKVIHHRDGYPVYSLSTPALFSPPAAHFIARTLYRAVQNRNIPNLMSVAVNDGCNARCGHCSFFEGVESPGRHVLTSSEWAGVIRDAQALGVSIVNLVGGEPLLHPELEAIVASVDKSLSTVVLFTNGWHLANRAFGLRRAGLDSVYVSLDAADAERHDDLRGTPGLFGRALAGLAVARRQGLSVASPPRSRRRASLLVNWSGWWSWPGGWAPMNCWCSTPCRPVGSSTVRIWWITAPGWSG